LLGLLLAGAACAPRDQGPPAVRLVDAYRPENLEGQVAAPLPQRTEWRFDRAAPGATCDCEIGPGIAAVATKAGVLSGRATSPFPILRFYRVPAAGDVDTVHSVEIRAWAEAGGRLAIGFREYAEVDLAREVEKAQEVPWRMNLPLIPGRETRTYTIPLRVSIKSSDARNLLVRPTDVKGTRFGIESVRLVFRREHLASIASGRSWQGLSEVYRESLVSRAGESLRFRLRLPSRPWLDLAVGSLGPEAATFEVAWRAPDRGSPETVVVQKTVTTPHRWQDASADLAALAGREVELSLRVRASEAGVLGIWGAPVVRRLGAAPPRRTAARGSGDPPQGVILILSESLRRDHLELYGYRRETMPNLTRRVRAEGTLVRNCVTQATWTKVSVPSLLTSLYASSHGVKDFADRLPAAATTLAEVYREAGHATLSLSSILFTGQYSNLHQGFEEVHEFGSLPDRESSKTAKVYVERLRSWMRAHREVPFFVFLHVADPHDPYRPPPPYDTLWSDPACAHHDLDARRVAQSTADPLLARVGMPTAADIAAAGLDPQSYVACERNWYDGAIRGMDAELEKLFEEVRSLGLDGKVLVVFTSDHGDEFLEHGRMFHGQSVYGELTDAPLVFLTPGRRPRTASVDETVQSIDVMPTLLELSRLPAPPGLQGRSLLPLLDPKAAGGEPWAERPAVSEKAAVTDPGTPPPRETESYALRSGPRKLVFNPQRYESQPEHELFDPLQDPLDQKDMAPRAPGEVERLFKELLAWHAVVRSARLAPDAEGQRALSPDELERLRSLGYIE
jgi:arylsulfatase A-like enzyme